ncbi:hypothetical protein [Microbacterium sp.]|uniref:hypothetical protein n=1 Tax=Microbacterium sp. TaxID=51671 RepID=UPI002637A219|nr:hypothetical protein [Microbacterium sp.]
MRTLILNGDNEHIINVKTAAEEALNSAPQVDDWFVEGTEVHIDFTDEYGEYRKAIAIMTPNSDTVEMGEADGPREMVALLHMASYF